MKITFGINVPYKSQMIDWEATDKKRREMTERGEKPFPMVCDHVPCIDHKDLYFELCDTCGNPVPAGRRSRGLTTCSPKCHAKKRDGWLYLTEQKERSLIGERPTFFWWKIRSECFERDNFICQECRKDIRTEIRFPGEAHHIVPISKGGTNDLSNLKTLCYHCHKKEHSHAGNMRRIHKCLEV